MRELAELTGRNIVVYDCEIQNPIGSTVHLGAFQDNPKTITWEDHELMGISVACLFDYQDGDYKVYMRDNLSALGIRLNNADLIVAFNQINFDNRLVRANGIALLPDERLNNYDMLVESRKALGWKPGSLSFPRGCKLDDHLVATLGPQLKKTANGEEAPHMYQRGEPGALVSYCLADVRREKALFEHIWLHGWVKTGVNGTKSLRHPIEFMNKPRPAGPIDETAEILGVPI